MAGHNKWSQIKHRKGSQDIKRNKIFTKINKELTVAVKLGGTNPDNNARLRSALTWAKSENMPASNINRVIDKAAGNSNTDLEHVLYEGYAPGNVALLVECLTDNKNRTIANLRTIFNKGGGNLVPANSVRHLFEKVGVTAIPKASISEERLFDLTLTIGGQDLTADDDFFYLLAAGDKMSAVYSSLIESGVKIEKSELLMLPISKITIDNLELVAKASDFIQAVEDADDVQRVFTNLETTQTMPVKADY